MPNCSVSIPKWETEGRPLSSNPTNVNFTMIKNDTLYFELTNTQTIYMYFNLTYSGTNTPSYIVSIYDATTYNLVSTLTSSLNNLSANIDLLAGFYIVCLRSIGGNFQGTVRADYYGFGRVIKFDPVAVESEQAVDFELTTKPKPKPCDKALKWEIVDGKLPPGIRLSDSSGMLYGRLPYLDCLEDDPDDLMNGIPSSNLFFTAGIGEHETIEPWGRRWNFKLRISVVEQPQNFEEKWFCMLIYNNWTRTQAKFFQEYENGLEYGQIVKDVNQRYSIGLCDLVCDTKIQKDSKDVIDEVIEEFLENGIELDDDVDILHIDIADPDLNSDNINSVNIYSRSDGIYTKENKVIENDGENIFGAYTNYQTTIEMDPEIIAQSNVYVPEITNGIFSETLMIEVPSYDEYLGFRQFARLAILNTESDFYVEYHDSQLMKDFLTMKENVKYEYIHYDPNVGLEDVEDSIGLSEKEQHYIYITYELKELPEVEELNRIINKEKRKGPWELFHAVGELVHFDFIRTSKFNET